MTPRNLSLSAGAFCTASAVLLTVACGGGAPPAPADSATPAAESVPAAAAAPVVRIIEPAEGSSSGHISLFRWEAVDGADRYRVQVTAATDRRIVWDSPAMPETEAHLPNTIALEPESYYWQVTALSGDRVLVTSPPSRFLVTP